MTSKKKKRLEELTKRELLRAVKRLQNLLRGVRASNIAFENENKRLRDNSPRETPVMVDIASPELLHVEFSNDYTVLWLNIDGMCRLRVQGIQRYEISIPSKAHISNGMYTSIGQQDFNNSH